MKHPGLWIGLLLAAICLVLLGGCQAPQTPPPADTEAKAPVAPPAPGPAGSDQLYIFIGVSIGVPYWVDAKSGLEERARELGAKTQFTGPVDSNIQGQARQLDAAIAQKPAGIMIAPANADALQPGIDRAVEAGIPVITIDTDSPKSKRYCYIGTENYQAGLVVGKTIAEALGGKGKIGISNLAGQWNLKERERGVLDAVKAYPGMKIVQVVDDRADPQIAVTRNREMLTRNADLSGIVGLNAASGPGIAQAVTEMSKKGKIKIVCFDRDEHMLTYIEDGTIHASIAQKTHLMSSLGLQLLYDLRNDRIKHLSDWRAADAPPLPRSIDTGIMVITKENVGQFKHGQ
ncbi:MAG: substrate-binding domain-containing protein [Armatimonadetes bacterium]|nr:substrate-binding domain-containing protein [Armatimonadota bacterium]